MVKRGSASAGSTSVVALLRLESGGVSEVQGVQAGGEGGEQVRAVEAEAVNRAARSLGAQLEVLQTLVLSFVPQTHHAVVGRAAGHHVVPVSLQTVEGAVVRLLPLYHTLPGGDAEVPQSDEGVVAAGEELIRRLKDDVQNSRSSTVV